MTKVKVYSRVSDEKRIAIGQRTIHEDEDGNLYVIVYGNNMEFSRIDDNIVEV